MLDIFSIRLSVPMSVANAEFFVFGLGLDGIVLVSFLVITYILHWDFYATVNSVIA